MTLPNDTPEGRRSNRKVVLVILSTETREHQRESEALDQLAQPAAVDSPASVTPEEHEQTAKPGNVPEVVAESLPETSSVPAQPIQQASVAGEN